MPKLSYKEAKEKSFSELTEIMEELTNFSGKEASIKELNLNEFCICMGAFEDKFKNTNYADEFEFNTSEVKPEKEKYNACLKKMADALLQMLKEKQDDKSFIQNITTNFSIRNIQNIIMIMVKFFNTFDQSDTGCLGYVNFLKKILDKSENNMIAYVKKNYLELLTKFINLRNDLVDEDSWLEEISIEFRRLKKFINTASSDVKGFGSYLLTQNFRHLPASMQKEDALLGYYEQAIKSGEIRALYSFVHFCRTRHKSSAAFYELKLVSVLFTAASIFIKNKEIIATFQEQIQKRKLMHVNQDLTSSTRFSVFKKIENYEEKFHYALVTENILALLALQIFDKEKFKELQNRVLIANRDNSALFIPYAEILNAYFSLIIPKQKRSAGTALKKIQEIAVELLNKSVVNNKLGLIAAINKAEHNDTLYNAIVTAEAAHQTKNNEKTLIKNGLQQLLTQLKNPASKHDKLKNALITAAAKYIAPITPATNTYDANIHQQFVEYLSEANSLGDIIGILEYFYRIREVRNTSGLVSILKSLLKEDDDCKMLVEASTLPSQTQIEKKFLATFLQP